MLQHGELRSETNRQHKLSIDEYNPALVSIHVIARSDFATKQSLIYEEIASPLAV